MILHLKEIAPAVPIADGERDGRAGGYRAGGGGAEEAGFAWFESEGFIDLITQGAGPGK